VSGAPSEKLLSIGEFSAATQLSAKALRLYDEHQILQPARTDPLNGYRYYRNDQVALGRLIRALRDMNLPLADVARVVHADRAGAERALHRFAGELDRRHARDKRALQAALLMLRRGPRSEALAIAVRHRPRLTAAVWSFTTDRLRFYERLRAESAAASTILARAQLQPSEATYCRLIDPLSEEQARVEILLPVKSVGASPGDVTLRHLAPVSCAVIDISTGLHGADFSAPIDALFDWFDRHGQQAIDVPWLTLSLDAGNPRTEILWAYQSANVS
jgi:DNA-binding transcriptional MerR regulator